jgi:hypothetical protein
MTSVSLERDEATDMQAVLPGVAEAVADSLDLNSLPVGTKGYGSKFKLC